MILSVSRRTDIPCYHQISKILITLELVDCIVFWTKNPQPMFSVLHELDPYPYYFQFTLTGYGQDIERNVPHKKTCMIPIFQELSRRIGKERVVWRYDPILFTDRYSPEYHLRAFRQIAEALQGYTVKCVISFVDIYTKIRKSMQALNVRSLPEGELLSFAGQIASIAGDCGITVATCAEVLDLSACGIAHNSCIDRELIERITGYKIRGDKDKNQRKECGCVESIEVGTYNTCRNGCLYCYANYSRERVLQSESIYDTDSPILCGRITEEDRITERAVRPLREMQISLQ